MFINSHICFLRLWGLFVFQLKTNFKVSSIVIVKMSAEPVDKLKIAEMLENLFSSSTFAQISTTTRHARKNRKKNAGIYWADDIFRSHQEEEEEEDARVCIMIV